jgi:hypothetical protein
MSIHYWEDDEEEFHVYVPIGADVKRGDVIYQLKAKHLKLLVPGGIDGIDGTLFSSVITDDCFW